MKYACEKYMLQIASVEESSKIPTDPDLPADDFQDLISTSLSKGASLVKFS